MTRDGCWGKLNGGEVNESESAELWRQPQRDGKEGAASAIKVKSIGNLHQLPPNDMRIERLRFLLVTIQRIMRVNYCI